MHCQEVEPQLVAWHDGELSPSAAQQVEEHLASCGRCVRRSQRLLAATPEPLPPPSSQVTARLHAALDVDDILTEAERRGPPDAPWRLPRWLIEPWEVSPMAILAYAALLAASLGWGWMNGAPTTSTIAGAQPTAPSVQVIPADAYAPASYRPAESDEPPSNDTIDR